MQIFPPILAFVSSSTPHDREYAMNFLRRFRDDQSGATAVEYGLIIAAIGAVLFTSMSAIKTNYIALFTNLVNEINNLISGG